MAAQRSDDEIAREFERLTAELSGMDRPVPWPDQNPNRGPGSENALPRVGPRDYELPPEDEGHFVPPEPPPLQRVPGAWRWALLIGGVVLTLVVVALGSLLPRWFVAIPIALTLVGAGLLALSWARRPPRSDDDGAVL